MAHDKSLINQMLTELRTTRSSIKTQNTAVADVLEKSNNALLQIEASGNLKTVTNGDDSQYSYNKETVNALTRLIDRFMNILSSTDLQLESDNLDKYLEAAGQKADYLGCNIRKLLAIWDTTQQMRAALERRETEIYSDNESETEEDCF